jgi:Tfp pilus assembly protein PilF
LVPAPLSLPPAPRRRFALLILGLVAVLAIGLALFHYFTGAERTLPVVAVPQLTPIPTTLTPIKIGLDELAVRLNGYLVTQTYDVTGPYVQPEAAIAWMGLLAVCLVYFLAVVTTLARPAFVGGMTLVIFLLMSLNADLLGVFDPMQQYFLVLALALLGLSAFAFHAFWPAATLGQRVLTFAVLVGALSIILLSQSNFSPAFTALHLASYATMSGAVAFALLVVWVSYENIHGLLWLNTQAENPGSRFGLLPFLLASSLYLGTLLLYYLNDGEVLILPNVRLEPYLLLLPAVLVGWLSLRRRAATYGTWIGYWPGAAHIYLILVALAAGSIGYALATANDPLITAGRDFTALALLTCGGAFLLYVLLNFAPLIRQRLRVYRVVYEPRRLPFYTVYVIGLGALGIVEMRNNFFVLDQVRAAFYNNLGDLSRLQSEQQPANDGLALLAERYYAESDVYDRFNHRASLGRAALYRFRNQRQNEINALRRALSRAPSEKISLRLAALFTEPTDFFDRQKTLQEGLENAPQSVRLSNDLAQLYTRSALTDSVLFYQQRAASLAPGNAVVRANQLAFLMQNQELEAARKFLHENAPQSNETALQSNALLLAYLTGQRTVRDEFLPDSAADLSAADFGRIYHAALGRLPARDTSLLPTITQLARRPGNEAYLEQLTFIRALTQYYGGRPVAAQSTLLPLVIGDSPTAAYYQQVRAMWLLDQGLYATAAAYYAEAAGNGFTEAALPRAYALALAGQPDSAQLQAAVAARGPNPQLAQQGQRLRRILALDFATQYGLATDSIKAQYVVLRGAAPNADPSALLAAAEAIATPAAKQAALLAQLPRVLASGNLEAVRSVLQRHATSLATKSLTASAWNVLRGKFYVQAKQRANLRELVSTGYFAPQHQPYRLYFQATLADKPADAERLYTQLVKEAPYLTDAILASADFHIRQRDYAKAYDVLLKGLDYNPESVTLMKAYILAAVETGLTSYAEVPLEKLRTLLAPAEYATFRSQYEAQRAAHAAALAPWN